MGASQLSAKSVRRIARATGLDIVRAWGHGGYVHGFVTADHRHGCYDTKSGEVGWDGDRPAHYTSCGELFPGYDGWCWDCREPGRRYRIADGVCEHCGKAYAPSAAGAPHR
jgi:hypothetical protein